MTDAADAVLGEERYPDDERSMPPLGLRAAVLGRLEGHVRTEDVDPYTVPVHGFAVTDPSGREQAERQAMFVLARRMRRQRLRLAADGTFVEVSES